MPATSLPSILYNVGMIALAPKLKRRRTLHARPCANLEKGRDVQKFRHSCRSPQRTACSPVERRCEIASATTKLKRYYHRGQQYSITALTDSNANVTERYAYTAYGTPTITNGAGSVLTSSTDKNRYTYTGREWDETLSFYHFRARMYDSIAGRFLTRDPIGFVDGMSQYVIYTGVTHADPSGKRLTLIPSDTRNQTFLTDNLSSATTNGETVCSMKIDCSCDFGDAVVTKYCTALMIPWDWSYVPRLDFTLTTTVTLDPWAITRHGATTNGVFGHELLHVINCRRYARAIADAFSSQPPAGNKKACQQRCRQLWIDADDDWTDWLLQEYSHEHPDSPDPYSEYPIDHSIDDIDWGIVPFWPLPSSGPTTTFVDTAGNPIEP